MDYLEKLKEERKRNKELYEKLKLEHEEKRLELDLLHDRMNSAYSRYDYFDQKIIDIESRNHMEPEDAEGYI